MAQSKMFDHCLRVYESMEEQAFKDHDTLIYRGFLSNLIQYELRLPLPYYTIVKRTLEDLGCIEQLKRGGGKAPSEWRLFFPPDPLLFDQSRTTDTGRRKPISKEALDQAIASFNDRLLEVERIVRLLAEEVWSGDSDVGGSEPLPEVQRAGN